MRYALVTINDATPPIPMEFTYSRYTLDKDSHRAANGLLIRNPIAKKVKFDVTFPVQTKADRMALLQMLDNNVLTIQYEDMFDGTLKTGKFYPGDFNGSIIKIEGDAYENVWYDSFKMSMVEY